MCSNNSPVCVHAWIAFGHLPTKQVKYAPNLLQQKKKPTLCQNKQSSHEVQLSSIKGCYNTLKTKKVHKFNY